MIWKIHDTGRGRPIARFFPRFVVQRFDRSADWLDGELFTVRGYKIERWDALNVIAMLVSSALYSLWLESWLKGMTLGPLMYALGWMAFAWML